ncbi:hypothetical protein NLU13_0184 [Sarocladium strictum]|uniref:Uncharacterized protein n=1 Tax=Sarocladium strictum TaxID=5046 RepID=A0AA39GNW6_SARSR|nr:hypothetical protein NLU13_0184 [Sarocladium strictum]
MTSSVPTYSRRQTHGVCCTGTWCEEDPGERFMSTKVLNNGKEATDLARALIPFSPAPSTPFTTVCSPSQIHTRTHTHTPCILPRTPTHNTIRNAVYCCPVPSPWVTAFLSAAQASPKVQPPSSHLRPSHNRV